MPLFTPAFFADGPELMRGPRNARRRDSVLLVVRGQAAGMPGLSVAVRTALAGANSAGGAMKLG